MTENLESKVSKRNILEAALITAGIGLTVAGQLFWCNANTNLQEQMKSVNCVTNPKIEQVRQAEDLMPDYFRNVRRTAYPLGGAGIILSLAGAVLSYKNREREPTARREPYIILGD